MGRVLESAKISPQTVASLGIAIHSCKLHIGMLYRVSTEESVKILHLGSHHDLRSEDPSEEYVCWIRPNMESDRAAAIAAFCRRIWNRNLHGLLPFGFSPPGGFFDHAGNQLKVPSKIGLTCAAFVLTVFHDAGFPLAKYDTWPIPTEDDIARQRDLIEMQLRRRRIDEAHAKIISTEVGATRYAPTDVAGAGTAKALPASYKNASIVGLQIRALIDKICPVR